MVEDKLLKCNDYFRGFFCFFLFFGPKSLDIGGFRAILTVTGFSGKSKDFFTKFL